MLQTLPHALMRLGMTPRSRRQQYLERAPTLVPRTDQAMPSPPSDAEIKTIFNAVGNGSEQVQSIVQTRTTILKDGFRGEDFTLEVAEVIIPEMLTCYELESRPGAYLSVRKALVRTGVNASPNHLQVPQNCLVGIMCVHAIYGTVRAVDNITDYR